MGSPMEHLGVWTPPNSEPKKATQDMASATQDPASATQDPASATQDPASAIHGTNNGHLFVPPAALPYAQPTPHPPAVVTYTEFLDDPKKPTLPTKIISGKQKVMFDTTAILCAHGNTLGNFTKIPKGVFVLFT